MKFKRFIKYFLIFGFIAVLPASCLSIWYFNNQNEYKSLQPELKLDDIEENYSFSSNKIENETYDVYIFPSLLYLDEYKTYLDGNSNILPEELFGYLVPELDDKNQLVYNENNEVLFDIYDNNGNLNSNYDGDVGYKDLVSKNNNYVDSNTSPKYSYEQVYKDFYNGYESNYDDINIGKVNDPSFGNFAINDDGRFPRVMHRYDRFGYWNYKEYHDGRYLPIKFSNVTQLSSGIFNEVVKDPYTDMGDPGGYYILGFAAWTYVDTKNNNLMPISYSNNEEIEIAMFLNRDLNHYFDLLHNLDQYADENNVIRLFPYFSTGKAYNENNPDNGARDAIRITYNNQDNKYVEKYMFYISKEQIEYKGNKSCKAARTLNLYLDNTISSIRFDFSTCEEGNYESWYNSFNLNQSQILYIVNTYGSGLYNFYLFIGNSGLSIGWFGDSTHDEDINNIYTQTGIDQFYSLAGKRLNKISDGFLDKQQTGIAFRRFRPFELCYEKVTELKVINDIPNNQDLISDYISDHYLGSQNFILFDNPIYERTLVNGEYVINNNKINQDNIYSYILRNIDFSNIEDNYFQLSFGTTYIQNINFNQNLNRDIIFDPDIVNNNFEYNNNQVFINAFNYFEQISININGVNQNFFKPKQDNYKGIYDFIIYYNSSNNMMEFYAYRHADLFIKLFARDVEVDANTHLAIHQNKDNNGNISQLDSLIWINNYATGDYVTTDDTCLIHGDSLLNVFDNYIEQLINNNPSLTKSNIVIRDHVTGFLLAYYKNDELVFNSFRVRKNYILYVDYINI